MVKRFNYSKMKVKETCTQYRELKPSKKEEDQRIVAVIYNSYVYEHPFMYITDSDARMEEATKEVKKRMNWNRISCSSQIIKESLNEYDLIIDLRK